MSISIKTEATAKGAFAMIQNLHKRKTGTASGFTIIEVMIVLAIAGLIMLIVFLAVPALQRNAHNTSIKNDVASVLAAMNEYTNNNNGVPPAALSAGTVTTVVVGAAGTNTATANVGYIDGTTVQLTKANAVVTNGQNDGTMHVYTGAACNANGKDLVPASARSYAILYGLEGGAKICQAS